jgi:hypothetical protein
MGKGKGEILKVLLNGWWIGSSAGDLPSYSVWP